MTRFDYCISNPPYQIVYSRAYTPGVYPDFMLQGSSMSDNNLMIHPARAFRGPARVDKNKVETILGNSGYKVIELYDEASTIFPETDIKGGVMISYFSVDNRNIGYSFHDLLHPVLRSIRDKILTQPDFNPIRNIIRLYGDNKISDEAYKIVPENSKHHLATNGFTKYPELFNDNDGVPVLGRMNSRRIVKYINHSYIDIHNDWADGYRVFLPSSNGGGLGDIGEPVIGEPGMICTQTFITFGFFESRLEAENCISYIRSRFARSLLSILKVTQHNNRETWLYVPLEDFSVNSDIDWGDNIDQQLYDKYSFSREEIKWINDNIIVL